jgi:hypothetical protein
VALLATVRGCPFGCAVGHGEHVEAFVGRCLSLLAYIRCWYFSTYSDCRWLRAAALNASAYAAIPSAT